MQTYMIDIRGRRQTTIPKPLLQKIGVSIGDRLVASAEGEKIILKAQKRVFLDTLGELQKIVKKSGITERQMQKNLSKIRKEIYVKRYSSGLY